MKIATWNVNSVRARLPNVLAWLEIVQPDVLLLQEIKCEDAAFPVLEFKALGYESHVSGQKSYNGVAILSRIKADNILRGLDGDDTDTQARYIEATIQGIRVASIYLPNGNPVYNAPQLFTEKYEYKLKWMQRLRQRAAFLLQDEMPVVLGGDYNVIPQAVDVYNPKDWEEDALFHPRTSTAWRELTTLGYTEAYRALHPDQKNAYTFWDYQAGALQRDAGLRIDHFLLSPETTDRLIGCTIDREPRGRDKASDHTPVIVELR